MGIRTFVNSDIIDATANYVFPTPTGDIVPSLTDGGIANVSISGNRTENQAGGGTVESEVAYIHAGTFDFQNFPGVPTTSVILKTYFKRVENGSLDITTTGVGSSALLTSFPILLSGITFPHSFPGPVNYTSGGPQTRITEQLEYHNPGMTYAAFDILYSPVSATLGPVDVAAGYPAGGSAFISYSVDRTVYQIEVWWQETYYSLLPTSGVVPGLSTVTITSENDDLENFDTVNLRYIPAPGEPEETIEVTEFLTHTPTEITFIAPIELPEEEDTEILVTIENGDEEPVGITTIGALISGEGGIALGGAALMSFIGNPSGIYTLIKNKRHDTLYERGAVDSIDVKIPNPFVKTSFVG